VRCAKPRLTRLEPRSGSNCCALSGCWTDLSRSVAVLGRVGHPWRFVELGCPSGNYRGASTVDSVHLSWTWLIVSATLVLLAPRGWGYTCWFISAALRKTLLHGIEMGRYEDQIGSLGTCRAKACFNFQAPRSSLNLSWQSLPLIDCFLPLIGFAPSWRDWQGRGQKPAPPKGTE